MMTGTTGTYLYIYNNFTFYVCRKHHTDCGSNTGNDSAGRIIIIIMYRTSGEFHHSLTYQ